IRRVSPSKSNRNADGEQSARLLMQMLQSESQDFRMILITLLAHLDNRESAQALARLAVFDVDRLVRAKAIEQLKLTKHPEALTVLVEGLRHLWPSAAANAAEALIALKATSVLPKLDAMLNAPDPKRPFTSPELGAAPMVRELVRL